MKLNECYKDMWTPAFYATSITDIIDLSSLRSVKYSARHSGRLGLDVLVSGPDQTGYMQGWQPDFAWNYYHPTPEILDWWTERVAGVIGFGLKDPDWGLGSLELGVREEAGNIRVRGKSKNGISLRCLADFKIAYAMSAS